MTRKKHLNNTNSNLIFIIGYTPQHYGVSRRKNQTIMEMPKSFVILNLFMNKS